MRGNPIDGLPLQGVDALDVHHVLAYCLFLVRFQQACSELPRSNVKKYSTEVGAVKTILVSISCL